MYLIIGHPVRRYNSVAISGIIPVTTSWFLAGFFGAKRAIFVVKRRKWKISMTLKPWTEDMSVGVDALDKDHKKILTMINDLSRAIEAGKEHDTLGKLLDQLIDYTVFHFNCEEWLFKETGYHGAAEHIKIHQALKAKAMDIREKYRSSPDAVLPAEVLDFLNNWLILHIQGVDKKYATHLHAHGIR